MITHTTEKRPLDAIAQVMTEERTQTWHAGADDGEVQFDEGPDVEVEACPGGVEGVVDLPEVVSAGYPGAGDAVEGEQG